VKRLVLPVIIGVFALFCALCGVNFLNEKKIFLYANSTDLTFVCTSLDGETEIYKNADNVYIEKTESGDFVPIGIHCYPRAVQYLDENRYVVLDHVNIKIMKNDTTNTVLNTLWDTKIGTVKRIYFDDYENIYYSSLLKNFRLCITKSNTMTIEEIDEIPQKMLAKQLKNSNGEAVSGFDNAQKSLCRATGETIEIVGHLVQKNDPSPSYFKILSSTPNVNWKTNLYDFTTRESAFLKVNVDDAVLFEFPNNIRPITRIAKGEILRVITPKSGRKLGGNDYGLYDFAYILHPIYGPIYIENSTESPLLAFDFAKSGAAELGFDPSNVYTLARTLVSNVRIYRYPTAVYPAAWATPDELVIKYLPRNYDITDITYNTSLRILREITLGDRTVAPRFYYEVQINIDGTPDRTGGAYVGYIDKGLIIDSFRGLNEKRISTNAKIVTDSGTNGVVVWDYNEKGVLVPNENEKLFNGNRIQIVGKYDGRFLHIRFAGFGDEPREGFIDAKYVVKDGINPWQIVALVSLICCISIVSWIIWRRFFRRGRAVNCVPKS